VGNKATAPNPHNSPVSSDPPTLIIAQIRQSTPDRTRRMNTARTGQRARDTTQINAAQTAGDRYPSTLDRTTAVSPAFRAETPSVTGAYWNTDRRRSVSISLSSSSSGICTPVRKSDEWSLTATLAAFGNAFGRSLITAA
jgi:hypothetical protein